MHRIILLLLLSNLLLKLCPGQSAMDSIWISEDTATYICSFDGKILDGIEKKRIFLPRDAALVNLVIAIEKDIRTVNYLKIYEAGFVKTAGVTWRESEQVFLYNPERIITLRNNIPNKDSLKLMIKAIVLHELGHHLMPHSVQRLIRKLPNDSLKYFEMQADMYMGQRMHRDYNHTQAQTVYAMNKLIAERDSDTHHSTKQERLEYVKEGWLMGGHTLAKASPLYNAFINLQVHELRGREKNLAMQEVRAGEYMFDVWMKSNPDIWYNESKSNYQANFRMVNENGQQYFELLRPDKKKQYLRIGKITDYSDDDRFKYLVYDQYYVFWYITSDGKVFGQYDGEFYLLGELDNR